MDNDCICVKHSQTCHDQKPPPRIDRYKYHFEPDYQTQVENAIQHELTTVEQRLHTHTITEYEIGQWLLWLTDGDDITPTVGSCLSKHPEMYSGNWLPTIIYVSVFTIKTRCKHILPRPYGNCHCNFSQPFPDRLMSDLKRSGYWPLKNTQKEPTR
jgi:hypothetical protein